MVEFSMCNVKQLLMTVSNKRPWEKAVLHWASSESGQIKTACEWDLTENHQSGQIITHFLGMGF